MRTSTNKLLAIGCLTFVGLVTAVYFGTMYGAAGRLTFDASGER